jgi:hypothetical protein
MELRKIVQSLTLDAFTPIADSEVQVTGGYSGDLLSHVLASAMPGNLWITIQHHANVVAVAQVAGLSAVLIADGKRPTDEVREQAATSSVTLLGTTASAFDAAWRVHELLAGKR